MYPCSLVTYTAHTLQTKTQKNIAFDIRNNVIARASRLKIITQQLLQTLPCGLISYYMLIFRYVCKPDKLIKNIPPNFSQPM